MTPGDRIKILRASYLGLTLEQFGDALGVGKTAISKLEKNERNLTKQMAKAICREYSVNYTWLTTGEGDMFVNDMDSMTLGNRIKYLRTFCLDKKRLTERLSVFIFICHFSLFVIFL